MYSEIIRLRTMLKTAGIPHHFRDTFDGYQICYPEERHMVCSVIEHFGSYGHDKDLLEIMGLLTPEEEEYDSVKGYLTAKEVFKRIERHHKDRKEKENDNL